MLKRMALSVTLLGTLGFIAAAGAHSLEKVGTDNSVQWKPERLDYLPLDRIPRPKLDVGHAGLESVVVLPNRWAQTQTLHVCFVGGTAALRIKILGIAKTWLQYINLALAAESENGPDCIDHDKSEVRIGFSEPGYWSYIGTDGIAAELVDKNLTSMNFEGFDKNAPAEPRFTGIVLHEWGHALGLHHEHQSPASGCDAEYDWTKLYAYYNTNYNWDKPKVDANVRQLAADRSAYDWSQRDPDSIMIYGSDPQFLKKGTHSKCYFHDNNALSKLDISGIERTYPKTGAEAALKFQSVTLPIVLDMQIPDNLRSALTTQQSLTKSQMNLKAQ